MAPGPDLDLTGTLDGFLGIDYERADPGHLVATVALRNEFLGDYGDLRTGVAAAIAESMCSFGTAIAVAAKGVVPMGTRNDTAVLARPSGQRLRADAKPVSSTDGLWVWDEELRTDDGALVAISRVTVVARPSDLSRLAQSAT